MKLKPFEEDKVTKVEAEVLNPEIGINSIMRAAGIQVPERSDKALDLDEVRKIFKSKRASLEDVAETIGVMMHGADTDGGRLKAAELALKVHGIFNDMSEKDDMVININVAGNGNVINLLTPRT